MAFPTDSIEEFVKFILIVFFGSLICYIILSVFFSFILWDMLLNNGLILLLLGVIIVGIIIIYSIRSNIKEKEENRLKKLLNEKSINIDEKIIKSFSELNNDKKQLLGQAYNVPSNKDEDLLISLWDIWKNEKYNHLLSILITLNKSNFRDSYSTLEFDIPESLIRRVIERDNYICQRCGKDLIDGSDDKWVKELNIEHNHIAFIKKISEGGIISEDNLETVCNNCFEIYKGWK